MFRRLFSFARCEAIGSCAKARQLFLLLFKLEVVCQEVTDWRLDDGQFLGNRWMSDLP